MTGVYQLQKPREFLEAIKNHKAVVGQDNGHWYVEGLFMRVVHKIIPSWEDERLAKLARAFAYALEHNPALFEQLKLNQEVVTASESLKKLLNERVSRRPNETLQHAANLINRCCLAWKYSHEKRNKTDPINSYPELAALIKNTPLIQKQFNEWILQGGSVHQFATNPATQQKVHERNASTQAAFKAIEDKKAINFEEDGSWYIEGRCMRAVRWLIPCLEDRRMVNVTNWFAYMLEQNPITFTKEDVNYHLTALSTCRFTDEGRILNSWNTTLNNRATKRKNETLKNITAFFQRISLAHSYRYMHKRPQFDAASYSKLLVAAESWKKEQLLSDNEKLLTDGDKKQLWYACHYPDLIGLVLQDESLKIAFFKWTLRNHNSPITFFEFPAMCKKIHDCYLASRGYFTSAVSQVFSPHDKVYEKDLKMPCEMNQRISLLNVENRVTLRNHYTVSVAQIFHKFAEKNEYFGKIEVLQEGLTNWHAAKMARWNPIANDGKGAYERINVGTTEKMKDRWWEEVPGKWISLAQAKQRYANAIGKDKKKFVPVDGINWFGRNMTTRRTVKMHMEGRHAYREIAIPMKNANNEVGYKILTFSKYSTTYPHLWLNNPKWLQLLAKGIEYAQFVAKTWPGTIVSPDPCVFNAERQHAGTVFGITPDEGIQTHMMREIQQDILKGRAPGRLVTLTYQIFVDNCAGWSYKWKHAVFNNDTINPNSMRDERIPTQLYNAYFNESEPSGLMGHIFKLVQKGPDCFKPKFYYLVFWILGASESMSANVNKAVSILRNPPWKSSQYFHLPRFTEARLYAQLPGLHIEAAM